MGRRALDCTRHSVSLLRHGAHGDPRRRERRWRLEASGRAINREDTMLYRQLIGAVALAVFAVSIGSAQVFDEAMYPNLKGQWARRVIPGLGGQPSFDQTKPWGFGQQAPLTPEYGMPMMTLAFWPQEYVITPDTTHILINHQAHTRRIYSARRWLSWPGACMRWD
jgi:hypothetical protein